MKVLLAEDDAVTRRVLTVMLGAWGYQVQAVSNGTDAWAVMSRPDAPRLALLDWEMPGADGVEICRRIRTLAQEPYTYVFLLTGRDGRRDLVAGLDAGADDYLTKPFDEAELEARLRVGLRIVTLQDELLKAREAMRHQAVHDGLTGVLNRRGLMEAFGQVVAQEARRGGSLGVLAIDLDRFKLVNDNHGHAVGDAVLKEAAERIGSVVRKYDRVGRTGGEEFVVLLPGCDISDACAAAEHVRARIAGTPFSVGGLLLPVTTSIGVAATDQMAGAERLIPSADRALYRAKREGRNRVEADSGGYEEQLAQTA